MQLQPKFRIPNLFHEFPAEFEDFQPNSRNYGGTHFNAAGLVEFPAIHLTFQPDSTVYARPGAIAASLSRVRPLERAILPDAISTRGLDLIRA